MKKILYILVLLSFNLFSQIETFDGEITEVVFSVTQPIKLVVKKESGEMVTLVTPTYIRYQQKFRTENGNNLIPPPLHVTDVWTVGDRKKTDGTNEPYLLYVDCSESSKLTIFLREHRWDGYDDPDVSGTEEPYSKDEFTSFKEHHVYGLPRHELGRNWAWDMIVRITNSNGDISEKHLLFKTGGTEYDYSLFHYPE